MIELAVISIVTMLRADQRKDLGSIRGKNKRFCLLKISYTGFGTLPSLIYLVTTRGIKRREREANHVPAGSTADSHAWSYTCTPPYAFILYTSETLP